MYQEYFKALIEIRTLAKAGGDSGFYDELEDRVVEVGLAWHASPLSDPERASLHTYRDRLLEDLTAWRQAARLQEARQQTPATHPPSRKKRAHVRPAQS